MPVPEEEQAEATAVRQALARGVVDGHTLDRALRERERSGSSLIGLLAGAIPPERSAELERLGSEARAARSPALPTAAPDAVGPYAIRDELGRGGMGVVYRARHPRLERDVALKVLVRGCDADAVGRERFAREVRAAARLHHPAIVAVQDVGEAQGLPYLVMDLVQGESLADRIKRTGPLDPAEAARITARLAEAVDYAHQHGILHRDLKPGNVMLTAQGAPLLTDFGLAKLADAAESLTRTGVFPGTPSYMAPEQLGHEGGALGRPTDVYGLGATLYDLLTGEPAFSGPTLQVLAQVACLAPAPPSSRRPGLDPDLDAVVLTCLEKDPDRRYPTAAALAADLDRYLAGEPVRARPRGPLRRAARRLAGSPGALSAALVLAAGVGAAVGVVADAGPAAAPAAEASPPASPAGAPTPGGPLLAAVERVDFGAVVDALAAGGEPAPATITALAERVAAAAADLERAADDAGAGDPAVVAAAQADRLGPTRLAQARLAALALERLAPPADATAVAALGAYLAAERDPDRARPVSRALERIGGPEAERLRAAAPDLARPTPPAEAAQWIARGRRYLDASRWRPAEQAFDAALERDPDAVEALVGRSVARRRREALTGALADADRALQLAPDRAAAYRARAECLVEVGDPRGAIADFDRCLALAPDDGPARMLRATPRLTFDDRAGAIADLERALESGGLDRERAIGARVLLQQLRAGGLPSPRRDAR